MLKKGAVERLRSIVVLGQDSRLLNSSLCSEQFYPGEEGRESHQGFTRGTQIFKRRVISNTWSELP